MYAYLPRNEEAREQIPEAEEERHNNGSNLMAWSESQKHHSIQCEVHKAHVYEEVEPQEVFSFPREPNH